MNKKIILVLGIVFSTFCHAQEKLSQNAINLIDSFFDLRMTLSCFSDEETEKILSSIDNFSTENKEKIKKCAEQEKIILENFIAMEKYNYLYEKPGQARIQHEELFKSLQKCQAFAQQHNDSELDAYFFCTWADITSCYMGYSLKDVIKYGTEVKPLYEKALKENPKLSYALTNIGQWYYFAPKIAGGSKKKTLEYFTMAKDCAESTSQKYFANIFLSQILFEQKDLKKCNELLDEATTFCPQSKYLEKIKGANSQGLSLFEFNKKKSSLNEEK